MRAQGALGVDVLERDRGEHRHLAHGGDEAGGEQRMAAEIGEEVGARTRIAWLPKTRFAATSSAASVSLRGVLLLARRVADGELGIRSALRSTLPEDSRGSASTISKWLGIM